MTRIKFHRVDNVMYGRYHSPWFKQFAEYCNQYFDVEWKDYASAGDQGTANIQLQSEVGSFGKEPPLSDVDCVIENMDTGQFVVLSFTEYFNSYVVHYLKSDLCQKVCLTHFSYHNIYHWLKRDFLTHRMQKVSPWFFGRFEDFDVEYYRKLREETAEFNKTLFYKGSGQGYREVVNILHEEGFVDRSPIPFNAYLEEAAKSKLALSYYTDLDKYYTAFHHPGEFCYRDIEYAAMGIPFIRIEYKDSVYNGFIPNYHYIAIPREFAYDAYKEGGNKAVADLIREKYNSVIDDDAFLKYISDNQKTWFDTYANWPISAEFTLKLTGMDTWI